tara:strand:+ start:1888 stop:2658 length:771 start_codon:yes stop_codon:yes gene_type:complete
MTQKEKPNKGYHRSEVDFFDNQYGEDQYHLKGFELRMHRDLKIITNHFGNRKISRALCVGCGEGSFEILLSQHVEQIVALDISSKAIEKAKSNATVLGIGNIDFRVQAFEELDWEEKFDAIICVAFLHHVPENELTGFLENCNKHLKTDGLFYSSDPNAKSIVRKIGRVILGKSYDRFHTSDERELIIEDLEADLDQAGFTQVEIQNTDYFLIPASYILAKWPAVFLRLVWLVDWVCIRTLWSGSGSSFAALSQKN